MYFLFSKFLNRFVKLYTDSDLILVVTAFILLTSGQIMSVLSGDGNIFSVVISAKIQGVDLISGCNTPQ